MFSGLLQKFLWANDWERRESFSKFVKMQVIWQNSIRESRTYFNVFRPIWDRKRQTEKQFEMLLPHLLQRTGPEAISEWFSSRSMYFGPVDDVQWTPPTGSVFVSGRTAQQQPFLQDVRHLSTLWHLTQRFKLLVSVTQMAIKRFLSLHVAANVARVLSRAASRNANHRNGHFTRG